MRIDKVPTGDNPPESLNVIIEVPTGGEPVKYEFDKESGALFVDRILHTPMRYPANYGFVPHTLSPDGDPLDALVITASGCGTTVKDYGSMFQDHPETAERAAIVAALARDITEFDSVDDLSSGKEALSEVKITYHSPCSMQHGQKITTKPKTLLKALGAAVREPAEGHLCCGSAGTYNLLQPAISGQLKDRKLRNIAKTQPQIVATGNIGCMKQLEKGVGMPLVHTAQLLDWATGGPKPYQLDR